MNHGENRKPPRNVETGFHVRCTPRLLGRLLAREPRTAAAAPIRFVKVDSRARTAFKHPRAVVVSVMARRGVVAGGWIRANVKEPTKTCFGCSRSVGDTRRASRAP